MRPVLPPANASADRRVIDKTSCLTFHTPTPTPTPTRYPLKGLILGGFDILTITNP